MAFLLASVVHSARRQNTVIVVYERMADGPMRGELSKESGGERRTDVFKPRPYAEGVA
jgi:hypothetical protein